MFDLVEARHKSIRLPNNTFRTPQSQHHVSSGYQPCAARLTSPRRLILACESKNTSKNKEEHNGIADVLFSTRKLGSHKPMNGETVQDRINLSKTQTLMVGVAAGYRGLRGVQNPWTRPNGLQHDTKPNGPKDGGAAP